MHSVFIYFSKITACYLSVCIQMLTTFPLISFFFIIIVIFRNKFVEFDMKPVCKKCYEKFPLELKKRLKKLAETLGRK